MSIAHISDGESGLSVRGKLNEVIDFTPVLDTAANFTANNPILNLGQLGIESDTLLSSSIAFKIGDGVHQWSVLPYANVSLSGLTTNKVLKAGSATTAVDSNITDDGTTVTVASPNNQNLVVVEDNNLYIQYLGTTNAGGLTYLNTYVDLQHDVRVNLNAPSVTKNGVEVATENYVDNLITGLNWKKSVLYSTNSGEDLSLTGLTAAIDGSLRFLSPTDRILVKNQSTQSLNGIYNPSSGAWTRVVDADSDSEILAATVYVREGSVEKDRVYAVNVSPITLGTTAITFALISGAGAYTHGSYLKLTGNVFDIDFTTFSTNEISEGSKLFFTDARVLTALLTGFASAAGTITAADSILSAINKLNGNVALKADVLNPTFIGTVTTPAINVSGLTASQIVETDASKNLVSVAHYTESFAYTGSPFTLTVAPNYIFSIRTTSMVLDESDVNDVTISGTTLTVINPAFQAGETLYIKYKG